MMQGPDQSGRPLSLTERGERAFIHPAEVNGPFRAWRDRVYFVLMLIFLILPWINVRGYQSILLSLPDREFAFFGLHFYAHDTPIVFFVLGIVVFSLAFVTALWGRIWCGWACPQTVFIDGVFRKVESWIEGNHIARKRLDAEGPTFNKISKRTLKWFAFFVLSLIISHSFLAYFVGAHRVLEMMQNPPSENWTTFLIATFTTAALMFNFGWFREQFCIIMCPYGRFQSVLMDDNSLAVLYDEQRGEPRGKKSLKQTDKPVGDCIDCNKCVNVCPTGVDIRKGVQLECIACTACIDACDTVMEKMGRPKGLIRYTTEAKLLQKSSTAKTPVRSMFYVALVCIFVGGLVYVVSNRGDLDFQFVRAIEAPYSEIVLENGSQGVVNHFKAHLQNQTQEMVAVDIRIAKRDNNTLLPQVQLVKPMFPLLVPPGKKSKSHLFIKFERSLLSEGKVKDFPLEVIYKMRGKEYVLPKKVQLIGPLGQP